MNNKIFFHRSNSVFKNRISAFFIYEDNNIKNLNPFFNKKEIEKIGNYLTSQKYHKNESIFNFDYSEKNKLIFIKIKKNVFSNKFENLGANFFTFIKKNNYNNLSFFCDSYFKNIKIYTQNDFNNILHFIHGFKIKSYNFDKYKKNLKGNNKFSLNIFSNQIKNLKKKYPKFEAIESGVYLTRDLVSEPPNVLNPKKYVEIIKKLSTIGLKITIYDSKKLKKMGMNALLGVGQGSINKPYVAVLEWKGNKKLKEKPLAFVGKGVCFDTGGISLKPARFMEEMKYDMAGGAVVVGLLKTLALRKAKVNAIGVVGLVENMPGGNAQRPGDIVKSYSGKTIEVLNTDAEGRLVLADILSFTEKKYNPKFIIDLATLTGAIIISLGEEYAGLFSNNDELSKKIFKASENVNEKVWRLPLHKNYDKLMDSNIADVQNINYAGGAGSITAAQFLQRFITNTTPWAHLDIAGMAFSKKAANLNPGGATGFGVRLLNNLIKEYYE